ncbi:MAG: Hpt domain-containing protein [Desulfovibrionaceae bacterium]|nr:Hpt domain-containing protein [Desulfovibrionaceae bacterium]MBF0513926.1 Hpt domain-containing protein [Desulfovibrionaceae bacterium]
MSENSGESLTSCGVQSDRVWDRQRLLDRYEGDMATVIELCQALREDLPAKTARLTMAAASGDLERLSALAHSVKGICGTMAAEPCRLLALELETAARGGAAAAARGVLPGLLACLDKLLGEMPQ